MFMGVFPTCLSVYQFVWWQHGPEEKRALKPLELELQMIVSYPVCWQWNHRPGRVCMLLIELPFQPRVKAILRLRDNLRIGLSHILWYLLSRGIIPHLNYFFESFLDHWSAMWVVSGMEEVKCSLTVELSKRILKDMSLRAKWYCLVLCLLDLSRGRGGCS